MLDGKCSILQEFTLLTVMTSFRPQYNYIFPNSYDFAKIIYFRTIHLYLKQKKMIITKKIQFIPKHTHIR